MENKGLGAVHLPRAWNILVLMLVSAISYLSPPYQALTSVNVSPALQSSLSAVSEPKYPLPSPPFPPPFPSLPFLPLRKTEQVTLFPWLHTHTQHFPLQDFWPLLIASALRKEGEKRSDALSRLPAHVSGNCSWMLLASILCTSTHNPSRTLTPSQLKARAP